MRAIWTQKMATDPVEITEDYGRLSAAVGAIFNY